MSGGTDPNGSGANPYGGGASSNPYGQPPQPYQQAAPPGWYTMPDGTTAWWDGYQWMAQPMPSAPALPYRPISVMSGLAQAALAAVALLSVARTWAHLRQRSAAADAVSLLTPQTAKTLDDASGVVGAVSALYLLAFIAAAVAVPVLCNRIHHNLEGPLGARGLDISAGMAAGWWFVPFANFVMPRRTVAEEWRASDPTYPRSTMEWKSRRVPALINLWWAFFVVQGVVSNINFTVTDAYGRVSASSVEVTSTIRSVGSACGVVGALLAVLVFRQLAQRHMARAAALGLADG